MLSQPGRVNKQFRFWMLRSGLQRTPCTQLSSLRRCTCLHCRLHMMTDSLRVHTGLSHSAGNQRQQQMMLSRWRRTLLRKSNSSTPLPRQHDCPQRKAPAPHHRVRSTRDRLQNKPPALVVSKTLSSISLPSTCTPARHTRCSTQRALQHRNLAHQQWCRSQT